MTNSDDGVEDDSITRDFRLEWLQAQNLSILAPFAPRVSRIGIISFVRLVALFSGSRRSQKETAPPESAHE
jgi:hypothetical protein